VYSASFFCCWPDAHRCSTSFPSSRKASMTRCSATAAFSTSPPAFSIMLSIVSIFARSSGCAFSLASKVGGPRDDASMAENRSDMGSSFACNSVTHVSVQDSPRFVQHQSVKRATRSSLIGEN